ncbi:MAG: metalloregulator ArsR/SmtB family transcription factor [Thermoleophilia bacterium]
MEASAPTPQSDVAPSRIEAAACSCGAPAPTGDAAPCCAVPVADTAARLARIAKALGDPIRLGMLSVMAQGRACCGFPDPAARGVPGADEPEGICVCEFQEQFGLAQSKASYHLRVLKEAGLVREQTRGKWSFYAVEREALAQALGEIQELAGV